MPACSPGKPFVLVAGLADVEPVFQEMGEGSVSERAREQISIEIEGTHQEGTHHKMSRWDAYVRQIYNMALNKNGSAARLLDQLRRQFPGDLLPGDPIIFLISEADARL
jgi:hypothetical protein